MGYLLSKAEEEGNFSKYKKYLFIRVFFDILIIVAIIWSFYYTGTYYSNAVNQCKEYCPCINTKIDALGAWTNSSVVFSGNKSNKSVHLEIGFKGASNE